MSSKKYGLILQDKGKPPPVFRASHNVFGNDTDSEEEASKRPRLSLKPSENTKRQARITQDKAVKEDPTVYQYDEVYEEMSSKKEKTKIKEAKKPQYIQNLMKAANKRKIENERRVERQIQKERENEGDEFKDKEVFVTSAYKQKLEEMRIEEEKEKREEYLESIGDVTKQQDLGGFYRHLYEQKLGKGNTAEENKGNAEENTGDNKSDEHKNKDILQKQVSDKSEIPKKRNYRKRKSSDSRTRLSEGEIEDSDEEINRVNLDEIRMAKKSKQSEENIDADSDFSIDESSDEDIDKKNPVTDSQLSKEKENQNHTDEVQSCKKPTHTQVEPQDLATEPKPKIDIWEKRTIGVVFEEALKRYYERKAARGS